jgi:hypothetical protein
MITASVDIDTARRQLKAISRAFPRESRRALSRYGGVLRRRIAKGVKGWAGVGPSELRNALHPRAPGGPLSSAGTIRILKPLRFTIVVGWIDALTKYAARWQDGAPAVLDKTEVRHALHRILGARGMRNIFVDPAGRQPERPVIPPIEDEASREAPRMVFGMVNTILDKELAK